MPSITFHVKRYDPARDEKGSSRVDDFVVPYETSLTVLEGLFYIQESLDGSLSFRYCCRASICGSCAMYINGRYRLACQTNVKHLHSDEVTVAPMPHLPLIKDLVCDMDAFFAKYEYVQPWLMRDSAPPGPGSCPRSRPTGSCCSRRRRGCSRSACPASCARPATAGSPAPAAPSRASATAVRTRTWRRRRPCRRRGP